MRTFLLVLLLLASSAAIYLFKAFLLPMAIASLMAVATANLGALLARRYTSAWRAGILTALMCALFLGPFAYAALAIASAIKSLDFAALQAALSSALLSLELPEPLAFLRPYIDDFVASPDLSAFGKNALNYASNFSGRGVKFFVDLLLILGFYFFANYYGPQILRFIRALLPLASAQWSSLLAQLSSVMSVVFYSVIATAVLEGFLFAIIAFSFGFDGLLCGILYAICSLIPIIGGALLWVPVSLLLYARGDGLGAAVLAAYSIIIISGVADTLIKPLIIKFINAKLPAKCKPINELLIFFAMVAGIGTFGFWGVILGPAVMAFFMGAAKLFTDALSPASAPVTPAPADAAVVVKRCAD